MVVPIRLMETLNAEDLKIAITPLPGGEYRLDWTGRSNARDPAKILIPFFDDLLKRAASHRIEMHFETLEHFNSSTIATLIHLINAAARARVPLTLCFDSGLRWQSLSFDALKRALRPFGTEASLVEFRHVSAGAGV